MEGKISHSGLLARSPEGHAARGMQIKGNEDLWVEIQANTFRNWVNEHLPKDLRVTNLSEDLCTGKFNDVYLFFDIIYLFFYFY